MATPLSMEAQTLLKLLADGNWHPVHEILVKLAGTVAPGRALRRYETKEASRATLRGPRKTPELSEDSKIASGARTLANVAMNSLKHRYVEIRRPDHGGPKVIRRRPDTLGAPTLLDEPSEPPAEQEPVPKAEQEPVPKAEQEPSPPPQSPPTNEPEPVADREPERAAKPAAAVPSELAGCPRCGLYVVNAAQHEEFHRVTGAEGPAPDVAFFSESQMRRIFRDEIGQALDAFQAGMQNWLAQRFAELGARPPATAWRLPQGTPPRRGHR